MLTRRRLLQLLVQGAVIVGVPGGAARLLAAPPAFPRPDPGERLMTWPALLWVEGRRFDRYGPVMPPDAYVLRVTYSHLDRPDRYYVAVVAQSPELMRDPDFITEQCAQIRVLLVDFLHQPPPHFATGPLDDDA